MNKSQKDSGVYYFLGNITSHISHVLPLYDKLGGTVVVTSRQALKTIGKYPVRSIMVNNYPYKIMRPGWRPKLIHEYTVMDRHLKETYRFLNKNAKVILFYELFDIQHPEWLSSAKKVFLHHGNGLKPFFEMQPRRIDILENYDYIASLGPNLKEQLLRTGVAKEKLLDIGIARTDTVANIHGKVRVPESIKSLPSFDSSLPVVSYLPTFWGASSVYDIGVNIVRYISDEYTLLFKPHPQTPRRILRKYSKIISNKSNIYLISEKDGLELSDIFMASSAVIGDVSSVMTEAILSRKPLIFAYGSNGNKQDSNVYRPIQRILECSRKIDKGNVSRVSDLIHESITTGVDDKIWQEVIDSNFYNSNGTSTDTIAETIMMAFL